MGKDIDDDLVRKLAQLLEETGLSEIEYGREDWHIRVARAAPGGQVHAVYPSAAPAAAVAAVVEEPTVADHAANPGAVKSPMVGVAYLTPEPGSPDFVKVGDTVAAGQTLLLIEAMKVFNPIHAPRAGKVTAILVENGSPVEYGEPLMIVE